MACAKNLKPLGKGGLTQEREREIRSKGGKASSKAKREKRDMREALTMILRLNAAPDATAKLKKFYPQLRHMKLEELDIMNIALVNTAKRGGTHGVSAFNAIMNFLEKSAATSNGEKSPADDMEIADITDDALEGFLGEA